MRIFLITILGIALLNVLLLYFGGFDYVLEQFEPAPPQRVLSVQNDVMDTFIQTLQTEVNGKQGVPEKGYEPEMFMAAFPGLVESDFDGVEASLGKYKLTNGHLEHDLSAVKLVHGASGAITRKGMETLYRNIAKRTGIDIEHGGTLTEVMSTIVLQ